MKIKSGVRVAVGFLLAGSLFLGGCGFKNQPVPPDSVVPVAVNDLRYAVSEEGITLNWSYPVKTIAGTDIQDISSFDLFRAVVLLEDYCGTCPVPFGEPMELSGGVTEDETKKRRQAEYKSALLRSGHMYFFKVRSRTSWWAESDDSNIVSFVWHVPAKAPMNLMAEAKESLVSLTWQPVTNLIDEREIGDIGTVNYQIMRSLGGDKFTSLGEPIAETSHQDRQVINGKKYFYKVQSIMSFDGNKVAGGVSETIAISPVDTTPPMAPAGVTAIQSGSEIKIIWSKSSEKGVAGYRIYRRLASDDKPVLLGEMKSIYTLYVDKTAPQGKRVYYSVTAVDAAIPANESSHSREATTRD